MDSLFSLRTIDVTQKGLRVLKGVARRSDSYSNLLGGFKAQVDSFVSCVGLWKRSTRELTKHSRVVTKEKSRKYAFDVPSLVKSV